MHALLPNVLVPLAQTAEGQVWQPAGHGNLHDWIDFLRALGPWLFLAVLVLLLLQAFLRRSRYRAVEVLDADAVERLRAAVAEAEQDTVGEIGVVVLERSDRHPAAPWVGAVILTGLGSFALSHLVESVPLPLLFPGQLLLGVAMYGLVNVSIDLRRRFVSGARATEMAEEQAIQEFHALRLTETTGRTGVLLFVSLFERQVVVLADEGIASQVEPDVWVEVDSAILANAKRGALEAGLLRGVSLVGAVLQERFPADGGGPNQVVDHVIVREQ